MPRSLKYLQGGSIESNFSNYEDIQYNYTMIQTFPHAP